MRVPGINKNVLLVGRKAMNRSVDGDLVVVELLPESEWKAPGDEVLDQDSEFSLFVPSNSQLRSRTTTSRATRVRVSRLSSRRLRRWTRAR